METQYQRGKIQEESYLYEMKKHSGEFPIIDVNQFLNPLKSEEVKQLELARSTVAEREQQLKQLDLFQKKHANQAKTMLKQLKQVALQGENIFAELMNTVQYASLGQITKALYEVGGQYRRNM